MDNRPIGIFDSGVGGLSVLKHLCERYENEKYIYFGDTKNLPYGEKTSEELIEITSRIFNWYSKQNVKAVVMACNTTSATVYDTLKNKYDFKIYPVIQNVSRYLASLNIKRLGVFATAATVRTQKYSQCVMSLNPDMQVFEIACPGWVEIVENNDYKSKQSRELIKKNIEKMLSFDVQKIVLGCTHYPYLIDSLSEYACSEMFIDPAQCFIDEISKTFEKSSYDFSKNKSKSQISQFYVSADPEKFFEASKLFFKINSEIKIANLNETFALH